MIKNIEFCWVAIEAIRRRAEHTGNIEVLAACEIVSNPKTRASEDEKVAACRLLGDQFCIALETFLDL